MTANMTELKNRGMKCLVDQLGIVDAEAFISIVIREQFDYTEWQKEYYDQMSPNEFMEKAYQYAIEHPYQGKGKHVTLQS